MIDLLLIDFISKYGALAGSLAWENICLISEKARVQISPRQDGSEAQWLSIALLKRGLWVQIPPGPFCRNN